MEHQKAELNLLCVICDRDREEKVAALVDGKHALFNLAALGKGVAKLKMLSYLGMGQIEKTLFLSILPEPLALERMMQLDEKFKFRKPGHGIAFRVAITGCCYHRPIEMLQGENGGGAVEKETGNELVLIVANRGYAEEVMDVARSAGATGGLVLHARGCGLTGAEKFFGVTIQPEKEIIMIVASGENGEKIMKTIAQKAGPESDAKAVSFSLPIKDVIGITSEPASAI